jgi:hypothetical protein
VQLYRYYMSQSSEFCRHNTLCCFSTSVYCCLFRYRLSPETFGYTILRMWHAELFLLLVQCHSVTNITDTETQNSKINTNILNRNAGYCACSGPENSFTLPIRSEQLEDPRLYFRLPSSFKGLHIRLRTERPGFDSRQEQDF